MISDRYLHTLDPTHTAGPLAANDLLLRLDTLTRRRTQLLRDYKTIQRNLVKYYKGNTPLERLTRLQREEHRLLARFAAIEARLVVRLQADYGAGAKPDWLRKLARQHGQHRRQQTKQQGKVVVMGATAAADSVAPVGRRARNHFKRQGRRVAYFPVVSGLPMAH